MLMIRQNVTWARFPTPEVLLNVLRHVWSRADHGCTPPIMAQITKGISSPSSASGNLRRFATYRSKLCTETITPHLWLCRVGALHFQHVCCRHPHWPLSCGGASCSCYQLASDHSWLVLTERVHACVTESPYKARNFPCWAGF